MKKFLLSTIALLAMTANASAVPLTLTGPFEGNVAGQQPAGFGFNNYTSSGSISSYNIFSTTPTSNVADAVHGTPYTVAQITGAVGSAFVIGIDVNSTGAAGETLQLFEVIVNGLQLYSFVGPVNIGNVNNIGPGFADWTLGVVNLSGLSAAAQVEFHAQWSNATGLSENFFLIPFESTSAVPGPIAGAGLPGLLAMFGMGGYFWKRRKIS